MNENIMDNTESVEEFSVSDTEVVENDSLAGTDDLESVSDTISDNDNSLDVTNVSDLPVFYDRYNEEVGGYPVYIVNDEVQDLSEDDIMLTASYSDYYSYLPTQMEDYFAGILANMKDTDYIAYYYRHYTADSYSSYVDYYQLVYDVNLSSGVFISGDYPCITVTRSYESSNSYHQYETTTHLSVVPDFSYGSFGHLSDLRRGVSHDETYTFLFIAGFCICSYVLHNLFSCLRKPK